MNTLGWLGVVLIVGSCSVGLAAPPGAGRLRELVASRLRSLQVMRQPYGVCRLTPDDASSLYASCYVAVARYVIDDLDLTDIERGQWIDHLNSFQNAEHGYYEDPANGQRGLKLHLFSWAVRALNALGGEPEQPVVFQRKWDDPGRAVAWLDGLDWSQPWGASIEAMHVIIPRLVRARPDPEWAKTVFGWLASRQDPETGYWGPPDGAEPFQGMGGTFHLLPAYYAARRDVPRAQQIIDSTLALRDKTGLLPGGPYANMDAANMLAHLHDQVDHRRHDIASALSKMLYAVVGGVWDEEQGFGNAHATLGWVECLAQCVSILPTHPYATVTWRSGWSPKLWRCEWQ